MKGMTIQLAVKTATGATDEFKRPIYTEELIDVADVLVGSPTTDQVVSTLELTGKKIAFVLGIPKGDTHKWTDTEVIIFGERFRTIGAPETGIQANIPLRWGQNVKVERYE